MARNSTCSHVHSEKIPCDDARRHFSCRPHLQTVCSHHSISSAHRSLCCTSNNIINVNVLTFLEEKSDLVTVLKNTKGGPKLIHGLNYCFSPMLKFSKLNKYDKYLMTNNYKTVMVRSTKTNRRKHKLKSDRKIIFLWISYRFLSHF